MKPPGLLQALSDGEGSQYPVATAEDIVIAKLEWFRRGCEVSERQWSDVLGVLRIAGREMDRRYMETMAVSVGIDDLLARAIKEAGSSLTP